MSEEVLQQDELPVVAGEKGNEVVALEQNPDGSEGDTSSKANRIVDDASSNANETGLLGR